MKEFFLFVVGLFFYINIEGYLKIRSRRWGQCHTWMMTVSEIILILLTMVLTIWWIKIGDVLQEFQSVTWALMFFFGVPVIILIGGVVNWIMWEEKEIPMDECLKSISKAAASTSGYDGWLQDPYDE